MANSGMAQVAASTNVSSSGTGTRGPVTRLRLLGWAIGCVSIAAVAYLWWLSTGGLLLGQDANWDLKNYHAYNGWALFNEGLSRDHHPAGLQGYLNPIIDIPTFFLVSLMPSAIGTLVLSLWHLSAGIPLALIARRQLPRAHPAVWICTAICALGGAATIGEIGTSFGDATIAPLILWGLYLTLKGSQRHLVWGGVLVGAGVGLKLTMAPYAVMLPIILLMGGARRRGSSLVGSRGSANRGTVFRICFGCRSLVGPYADKPG